MSSMSVTRLLMICFFIWTVNDKGLFLWSMNLLVYMKYMWDDNIGWKWATWRGSALSGGFRTWWWKNKHGDGLRGLYIPRRTHDGLVALLSIVHGDVYVCVIRVLTEFYISIEYVHRLDQLRVYFHWSGWTSIKNRKVCNHINLGECLVDVQSTFGALVPRFLETRLKD